MRERPHVGRRLWRRRKKRVGADASDEGKAVVEADGGGAEDEEEAEDGDEERAEAVVVGGATATAAAKKPGFFSRLFGKKPPPPPEPTWAVDPVREILAVPRGAARLDAFEQKLLQLDPKTPEHKKVALGFHRELTTLATDAGVDLTLFESRVTACARALIAAGEDERAGALYVRLGRRHQAAESFIKAGAIDALEDAHAELAFAEGGPKPDARLQFERFEALFLVGLRDDALTALQAAVKLWDNPVYVEVLQGFMARLPPPKRLTLTAGEDVVRVLGRFPLILGRGEESAVRIESPLVSRAHVQLDRRGLDIVAKDLVSSGGTRVDGVVMTAPTLLPNAGTIDLAGVVVDVDKSDRRLLLRPRLRPRQLTLAPFDAVIDDDVLGGLRLTMTDERVRLAVDERALLNNERMRRDTLLLAGDRLTFAGRTWTVG